MEIDETAKKYYELLEWYEHEDDPGEYAGYKKPFSDKYDNVDKIAEEFFNSIFRNVENCTDDIKKIIEKQRVAMRYLKRHQTEALLSGEPFVRKMAELIYKEKRKIP